MLFYVKTTSYWWILRSTITLKLPKEYWLRCRSHLRNVHILVYAYENIQFLRFCFGKYSFFFFLVFHSLHKKALAHITPLSVWSLAHMQCIITATNQVIHNFLAMNAANVQKHECYITKCMLLAMPFVQYTRGLQDNVLSKSKTESVKDEEIRLITLLSLPAGF